jgi:hypothetical protein
MRIVKDNRARLHDFLGRATDAELTAPVEQRLVGADEHGLAVVELGRKRLLGHIGERRDTVLLALSQDLQHELACGREVNDRFARLVHDRLRHE